MQQARGTRRLLEECLSRYWFESIEEAKQILERWRMEYNTERQHSALDNRTPIENLTYLGGLLAENAGLMISHGSVEPSPTWFLETVRPTL